MLRNTPEDGVTIDASVLKVDSGCAICANDDLELHRRDRESVIRVDAIHERTLSYHLFVHVPT